MTKYWGCGLDGVKVRGIEARQHSTSPFVKRFQKEALEALRHHVLTHGVDVEALEALLLEAHDRARTSLMSGHVPLVDLPLPSGSSAVWRSAPSTRCCSAP